MKQSGRTSIDGGRQTQAVSVSSLYHSRQCFPFLQTHRQQQLIFPIFHTHFLHCAAPSPFSLPDILYPAFCLKMPSIAVTHRLLLLFFVVGPSFVPTDRRTHTHNSALPHFLLLLMEKQECLASQNGWMEWLVGVLCNRQAHDSSIHRLFCFVHSILHATHITHYSQTSRQPATACSFLSL